MSGASDAARGMKAMLDRLRGDLSKDFFTPVAYRPESVAELSEMPAPRHGTTEARLYAVAEEIWRDEGPEELSRLADRFMAFAQEMMRRPR